VRILVIEDDERSAQYLVRGLRESGFVVDRAADGELGLSLAGEGIYDLLIVDRLLPKLDGLTLVTSLRRRDDHLAIIMVSAVASVADRIEGLKAGCDDYLAKPYAFSELLARIDARARRLTSSSENGVVNAAGVQLNTAHRTLAREGHRIDLQLREALLLQVLMQNCGSIVTRSMLLEAAWSYDFEPRGNIIDMHIHRIRKKIDAGFSTSLIQTVQGVGYIFGAPEPGPVGAPR
jgi:two-component system, OmpR family, response regulator